MGPSAKIKLLVLELFNFIDSQNMSINANPAGRTFIRRVYDACVNTEMNEK